MKFLKSACIEPLYSEIPFYERFKAAKDDGFEYIEFWGRDDKDLDKIIECAKACDVKISGFNGDSVYSLVDPTHKEKYIAYLKESVEAAKKIGAESVTIHSNGLGDGGLVIDDYKELSDVVKICSMYDMLLECAKIAEESGICMNLEPLNTTTDHVGNYLATTKAACEMTRLIGCDKLKVLYDVYHMQLNEGSICDTLTANIDQIGHIHVADAPGRHEPGTGEINYHNVFLHLEKLGYKGRIGFELFPKTTTAEAVKAIMTY